MAETARRPQGPGELRGAVAGSGTLWLSVLFFSLLANLLMLSGPLYMLQVYDRVLPSRSVATLVALSILLLVMFTGFGLLDHARARLGARIGASFQNRLERRVLQAGMDLSRVAPKDPRAEAAASDLASVQRFLASPVLLALCDVPWVPVFTALIFVFHPLLGWVAVGGSVTLIVITLLNQRLGRGPSARASMMGLKAEHMVTHLRAEADTIRSLGMQGALYDRWTGQRAEAQRHALAASDVSGGFSVMTKTLRLLLQSVMLGVGAWLVLKNELGAGAMIASSILMGRALAPVESAIGQWALVGRAREGWVRLSSLLSEVPPPAPRTALPRPPARIDVKGLALVAPGESRPVLRDVAFEARPGQAIGIIGPSGSGKTSLARALTGLWPPAGGEVRLGGATLDQYDPDVLGALIGYLPQRVTLFDGTLAENIARLTPNPDPAKIVEAARKAGAHDMILGLPQGYDTAVSSLGGRLSGGQVQRIGLARALFGQPVFLVLDEPNSNLDLDGTSALNAAIRGVKAEGGVVFIMAHRPAAIQECDMLLVMEQGRRRAFGPRDAVLRQMVQNHTQIVRKEAT
ncbi:type I secretion system permease/ATPase [Falsirhodobacter sp. 20TX0035]|uniref:type I secretion system permease/ATPase n=1 Tax=Falsirhodobacter sp. 20TX0035 TaxID=3022019 RepID=UPI00232B4D3C|nr:type I secretion system permease/ATPase [Falsirhodobacter sp. 20TX0035]MDB6454046.1 type I secretion system permease/ATPase [Falsirhodobacter sp. 20TX0035]